MFLKIKQPIQVLTGRQIAEEIGVSDLKVTAVGIGDIGGPGSLIVTATFVYEKKNYQTRSIVIPDKFQEEHKDEIQAFIRLMLEGISANEQYAGEIIDDEKEAKNDKA